MKDPRPRGGAGGNGAADGARGGSVPDASTAAHAAVDEGARAVGTAPGGTESEAAEGAGAAAAAGAAGAAEAEATAKGHGVDAGASAKNVAAGLSKMSSPFPPSPQDDGGAAVAAPAGVTAGAGTAGAFPNTPKLSLSGRPIRSNRGVKRHSIVDSPPPPPPAKKRKKATAQKKAGTKKKKKKKKKAQKKISSSSAESTTKSKPRGRSRARSSNDSAATCEHKRCRAIPCYGLRSSKIKRWCKDHHPPHAISLRTKVCMACCRVALLIQSYFGFMP